MSSSNAFGRSDEHGNVYLITSDGERLVGQYPDATPEEALAFFERKYQDLESQLRLLEQRAATGAKASTLLASLKPLQSSLPEANVVGDLPTLERRAQALQERLNALSEQQKAASQQALQEALVHREQIVVEIEQLAQQDPQRLQWKRVTQQIQELFTRWQEHQKNGPRIPKDQADALWARFRTARHKLEAERRDFYSHLDSEQKAAKRAKQAIVARAEELAESGTAAVQEYRDLLAEWKRSGRAGAKADQALWDRFKQAGDKIFAVRHEEAQREQAEYEENLTKKLAILEQIEAILPVTDAKAARKQLAPLLEQWDAIGRVPRSELRSVEDRLAKVERAVKRAEEEEWRSNNPETKARKSDLASQLDEAIAKLEAELSEAQASGDQKRIKEATEALEARKLWRNAIS